MYERIQVERAQLEANGGDGAARGAAGFGCLNHDFSGRAVTRRHRRYTDRCSTRPLARKSAVLGVTIRALSGAISLSSASFLFFFSSPPRPSSRIILTSWNGAFLFPLFLSHFVLYIRYPSTKRGSGGGLPTYPPFSFFPQGESRDYEAVEDEISRLRICITRGENTAEKKRQITRKVEPLRLSWY